MKRYILILSAAIALVSCNDDYLEKYPLDSATEATAFKTDSNFETYSWGLYDVFWGSAQSSSSSSSTNFDRAYHTRSQNIIPDVYAGYLAFGNQTAESGSNPYRAGTATIPSSGGGWDFSTIRDINLMLDNIDGSEMDSDDKLHYEGVGRFFRAYNYAELVSRFGDVPWLDHVLTDDDEDLYGVRTPRAEVVAHIIEDLEFAVENIVDGKNGANTVSTDCARAMLSRFALFEGTWRKYHSLGDEDDMLDICIKYSAELIAKYPTISDDYDSIYNMDDLSGRPGMIFYKEFVSSVICHQTVVGIYEMPQCTKDLYLCQDGKPISTSSMYDGNRSVYDEYRNRDQRLLLTVVPPYAMQYNINGVNPYPDFTLNSTHSVSSIYFGKTYKGGVEYDPKTDPSYTYNPNSVDGIEAIMKVNYEYKDLMQDASGEFSYLAGKYTKTSIPLQNWSGTLTCYMSPNITSVGQGSPATRSGNTIWRMYNTWDEILNTSYIQVADRPIFWIEEIMVNYAEAMYERGQFTQTIADLTINKLRSRANVADLTIANITTDWDPNRDQTVDPVLWEIRRERQIELMCEGFGWMDIRRWKRGEWYFNRPQVGVYVEDINDYMVWSGTENDGAGGYVHQTTWENNLSLVKFDNDVVGSYNKGSYTSLGTLNTTDNVGGGYIFRFANGTWDDKYYLMPIPTEDILLNPNLKQNDGWI